MSFLDAVINVWINYGRFRGRASVAEFWWRVLFALGLLAGLFVLDGLVSAPTLGFPVFDLRSGHPLSVLGALALATPTLATASRRLHDTSRSARWLLLGLVPVIGNLALIWLLSRPGVRRDNRHGATVEGLHRT